ERRGVAARMRNAGVPPLRQDRFVILDQSSARDLLRHELLQHAESQRLAVVHERRAIDRRLAQQLLDGVNYLLRAPGHGADGLDLPALLSLARQLDQILAERTNDAPAAGLEPLADSEIELKREIAEKRDARTG